MRTIGIDLAVQGPHKAIVADERGRYITPVLRLYPRADQLDALLSRARQGAEDSELLVVMEPTGMAWFPIAVYLARRGIPCYLVNSQQVADLRRYYRRHAKSDRIDVRVLANAVAKNSIVSGDRPPLSRTGCWPSIVSPGPACTRGSFPTLFPPLPAGSEGIGTIPGEFARWEVPPFDSTGSPATARPKMAGTG